MIGSYINPYKLSPADWDENGLPYGAYCRCHKCGYVGRSTSTFDYHADNPGEPLTCEQCKGGNSHEVEQAIREEITPENPGFV